MDTPSNAPDRLLRAPFWPYVVACRAAHRPAQRILGVHVLRHRRDLACHSVRSDSRRILRSGPADSQIRTAHGMGVVERPLSWGLWRGPCHGGAGEAHGMGLSRRPCYGAHEAPMVWGLQDAHGIVVWNCPCHGAHEAPMASWYGTAHDMGVSKAPTQSQRPKTCRIRGRDHFGQVFEKSQKIWTTFSKSPGVRPRSCSLTGAEIRYTSTPHYTSHYTFANRPNREWSPPVTPIYTYYTFLLLKRGGYIIGLQGISPAISARRVVRCSK